MGPITSLNRYERKKNVGLALEAFAVVKQKLDETQGARRATRSTSWTPTLVIAGESAGGRAVMMAHDGW